MAVLPSALEARACLAFRRRSRRKVMAVFADLIRWKSEVSILALTGLVAATLMAGTTNTSRLLYGSVCARKRRQDQHFSPERVKLLLFTAGAGLHYLPYLPLLQTIPTLAPFL